MTPALAVPLLVNLNFYFLKESLAPEIPEVSPEEEEELANVYKDDRITLESETLYANVT
jgi:DNA-directed RNA polymerase subunit F